jgi:dienelactone hydrolase
MTVRMLSAALAAAFALAAGPVRAEMKSEWVEYSHGDAKLKAYMAYDDKVTGKRPAVLMIHARDGMSPTTLEHAAIWAKLGYVSFAADIYGYGQGVLPKTVPEMEAQTNIYTSNHALMRARTQAGFDILRQNPLVDTAKIATLGYCFGGTVAIEFAEMGAPVVGTVTIHGSFRDFTPDAAKNIKGRVLILHGAEDPVAPLTEVDLLVKELRAAKVNWQLELYSGTEHGFSTPKNASEERANTESQAAAARFFKEVFGIPV